MIEDYCPIERQARSRANLHVITGEAAFQMPLIDCKNSLYVANAFLGLGGYMR